MFQCVNALSDVLIATVMREGRVFRQQYEKGKPVTEVEVVGETDKSGTIIKFHPDSTIFQTTDFNFEILSARLRELAFLNKGILLTITDQRRTC